MLERAADRNVSLIDRREYWREPFARALRQAGYGVAALDGYALPPEFESEEVFPDLVVLACTAVTAAELRLVRSMAHHGLDVLVLVAALPPNAMRELFRAGAYDVIEMPVREEKFVALVETAVETSRSNREHKTAVLAGL